MFPTIAGDPASDVSRLLGLEGLAVTEVEVEECSGARVVHVLTADELAAACPSCGVFSTEAIPAVPARARLTVRLPAELAHAVAQQHRCVGAHDGSVHEAIRRRAAERQRKSGVSGHRRVAMEDARTARGHPPGAVPRSQRPVVS